MKIKLPSLIYFSSAILLLIVALWLVKFYPFIADLLHTQPTQAVYLKRIYPLLKPSQASPELFNQLNFFQSPYPKLANPIYKPNANSLPQRGDLLCLDWLDCRYLSTYRIVGSVYKNDYDPNDINSYRLIKGYPSHSYVEVYHNGWYQEPGLYYYVFKGTGIFLNVGKTLVARNKVEALFKLGVSREQIFSLGGQFLNRDSKRVNLYLYVKNYANNHHLSFKHSVNDIIKSCIQGDNYANNRVANSGYYDVSLWLLGKKQGYDTIQMTAQPNGTGGWGFEMMDLRMNKDLTLKQQWEQDRILFSIRNPLNLKIHQPCQYKVPFDKLHCIKPGDTSSDTKLGVFFR